MEKKFSKVVPTVGSKIEHFHGEQRQEMLKDYPVERHFSRVVPTEGSNYKNFKKEDRWKGIKDFNNRKEAVNNFLRDNLSESIVNPYEVINIITKDIPVPDEVKDS